MWFKIEDNQFCCTTVLGFLKIKGKIRWVFFLSSKLFLSQYFTRVKKEINAMDKKQTANMIDKSIKYFGKLTSNVLTIKGKMLVF